MTWTLAYAHDSNGNRTSGDIEVLIRAIRKGSKVRVLIETPATNPAGPYDYITEAQILHVRNGVVFATNTLDVSTTFVGDALRFQEDSFYYMIIASTTGELEQIRWDVGVHTLRGHNQDHVAMKWFVD